LNHHLKVYQQVFIGVGALIGVFVLLALVSALALPSYRNRIKENLGLRPVISANRQGRNTMTTGSRGRNTMATGSRQYLNIASPNKNETHSITVNPENFDASNTKDSKVHGMTTNVKKVIIKKNKKKMTSKYDAVYIKGKLVEKIGMPLTLIRDNITLNSIT
jgi:hypothetical protein